MASRIQGKNYLIWNEDSEYGEPIKVNKNKLDKSIQKIGGLYAKLAKELDSLRDSNYDAWSIIDDATPYLDGTDAYRYCLRSAEGLQELYDQLQQGNDELPPEHIPSLHELGFRKDYCTRDEIVRYEKVLEDTDEQEIVEEVIIEGKSVRRRKRTIIWEPDENGKHSKKITYKTLPVTKAILKAVSTF